MPTAIVVRLESEPPGADVFEQNRKVGKTPYEVVFKTKRTRSLRLASTGFEDLRQRIDPKSVTIPEGGGPVVMKVQLKVATVEPAKEGDPKAAPPGTGVKPGASKVPAQAPAPPKAAPSTAKKPAKPVKPRRRKPKVKKPKPGAIRNPFE